MTLRLIALLLLLSGRAFGQQNSIEHRLDSLHKAAFNLLSREKIKQGITAAEACLELATEHQATYPRYYARALELKMMYEPAEAVAIFKEVKAFRREKMDTTDADYARTLQTEAMLERGRGNIARAKPLMLRAMELVKRDSAITSIYYSRLLDRYATLLQLSGDYTEAEAYYKRADTIQTANGQGPIRDTLAYASTLLDLGSFYNTTGRLREMEKVLLRCRDLRRAVLGEGSVAYAEAQNNLAVYYARSGQLGCAKATFQKVLYTTLLRQVEAGMLDSIAYGAALNNLGNAYQQLNFLDTAETFLLQALTVRAQSIGKKSFGYNSTLISLGKVYYLKKDFSKADSLWGEAERWARANKAFPALAAVLQNFGNLYLEAGKPDLAWARFEEALKIRRDALRLPDTDPEIIKNLRSMAEAKPNSPEGRDTLIQANTVGIRYLRNQAKFCPEFEMLEIMKNMLPDFEAMFGLLLADTSAEALGAAYDSALALKETVLKNAAAVKNAAIAQGLGATLEAYQQELRLLSKKSGNSTRADSLSKRLTSVLPLQPAVHWQDVQKKLKPGEVAIEFIQYREPALASAQRNQRSMYGALVLCPGDRKPCFAPLCSESELEALWKTYEKSCPKDSCGGRCSSERFDDLYDYNPKGGSRTLYAMIWQPIESLLRGGALQVFYSPSGHINLFSLRALKNQKGDSPKHHFVALSSTGNLVVNDFNQRPLPTRAVLFGGIDPQKGPDSIMLNEVTQLGAKFDAIGASVAMLTREAATESSFSAACKNWGTAERVSLHMAVHGCWYQSKAMQRSSGTCSQFMSGDPMFQSYLELSSDPENDGALTAFEVSLFDFSQVELAYLSSCRTGLGEVRGFEGVFGLVRALKIAGAKKIIVCLNDVDTGVAREMTGKFYQKWLSGTKTVREAFDEAQTEIRALYPLPRYWATFMLIE